jgi:hypothetical protein
VTRAFSLAGDYMTKLQIILASVCKELRLFIKKSLLSLINTQVKGSSARVSDKYNCVESSQINICDDKKKQPRRADEYGVAGRKLN